MRHLLINSFDIGSMEEYFLLKEIVTLNLTVKTILGWKGIDRQTSMS